MPIFTKEEMPRPLHIFKPGAKVSHLTDDMERTLCGRIIDGKFERGDHAARVCASCATGVNGLRRLKKLAGV
jgi:hypothetical protein